MKKTISAAIFILFTIESTFTQNYQTINSGRISYFENEYHQIKSIRIDSTKYLSDSILYPFTVLQEADYGCFTPFVASWIGPKVIIKENGMNLFFNRKNDTIKIHSQAHLNDKWIAYYFEDSSFVEAVIRRYDTLNFLNLNDSVKTIGFQVYDKNMNPLEHDINQMDIRISKNYGLVRTLNFYLFPDYESYYPWDELTEYTLVGLSNPKAGFQNITWFDINDFLPGDELHIKYELTDWYGVGSISTTTDKAIYKYLERFDYDDSIVYHYSRRQSIYRVFQGTSSLLFYDDTLTSVIKPDPDFDKLPGEPVVTDYSAFNYYVTSNSKTDPSEVDIFYYNGDSCWMMLVVDGCLKDNNYLKGLGGPYYSCTNAFSFGGVERKLVYYKKGETTWGTPLVVTNIGNAKVDPEFEVYPNPASKFIKVTQPGPFNRNLRFALYDLNGRNILNEAMDEAEKQINLENVRPGIYLFRILDKDKTVYLNKLIVD